MESQLKPFNTAPCNFIRSRDTDASLASDNISFYKLEARRLNMVDVTTTLLKLLVFNVVSPH